MSTPTLSKVKNTTLGRGKLYFKKSGESGHRYVGTTPAFNVTTASQTLKHYDADQGVRVQDKEVVVQVDYSGSFTTDNVNFENLAMLLFGSAATVAVASGSGGSKVFNGVKVGEAYIYDLGKKNVSSVTIASKVLNTDFTVDLALGHVTFIAGGAISDGDNVTVGFSNAAYSYDKVASGGNVVEGSLMFIADNPEGDDIDYVIANAKLSPNGEFAIKAQEWQQLPFSVAIGVPADNTPAITAAGRPYTP